MKLGVCYYPEHWPEAQWTEDAERMAKLGLTDITGLVRWAVRVGLIDKG